MKKIFHYVLAFLIPISIFLLAMYMMDLYPFGDISIRVVDAISQYPSFFEGLKDMDLFTFKIGLGTNFYTIFTTYLASPLSFLYFFFENYQFDLFFVILVLLKLGLIGLNMNILLNYKRDRNKYSLIFSTIYALSGYVALYYFNYQFLDALYMLPLIMIGIDKLVNDNKNLMYFITLTLMIIFHYYTAYMICIFSVIYFFFLLVNSEIDKKDKRKRIIKFFGTSLFCGLCSSFITIPSIYSLLQGRSSWYNNINYLSFNKNVFSVFYDFTSGSTYGNDIMYGAAPLFMTLFVLVLIIFLFFDKNISKKYKTSVGIILIIFILSLSFYLFYYAWHVFQEPTFYPGRFVFCFVCFFVLISYQFFLNFNININLKKKLLIILLFCFFVVLSFIFKIHYSSGFIFDKRFIVLLIFNLLIYIYYIFCINNKKLISLTIFLIFLEILINLICSFNSLLAHNNYNNVNVDEFINYVKNVDTKIQELETNDFFRIDFNDKYLKNSGFIYNYNGISYFNSLYNNNLLEFANDYLVHSKYDLHNTIYNGDFIIDSILSTKYKLSLENDNVKINEKSYTLNSLGFLIPYNERLENKNIESSFNDLLFNKEYQIYKKFLRPKITLDNMRLVEDNWEIIDETKNGRVIIEYIILYDSIGYIELNSFGGVTNLKKNLFDNYFNMTTLYLNDNKVKDIYMLKEGDNVKLEIEISKEIGFVNSTIWDMYIIKEENYRNYIKNLNDNILTNVKLTYNGFNATANVKKDNSLLLLTIPYDNGNELYVNGEKKELKKYFNGISAVQLDKGDYTIKFNYRVKGLKSGIILSVSSWFIFIFIKGLEKIKISRYNYYDNKEEIYK